MVSPAASLSRPAHSISAAVTAATSVPAKTAAQALDEHFAEKMRLVDPDSREGTHVTQLLRGIGDRLLAADNTTLKHTVSYHLSDSKEPEAFVFIHEGTARVVVSKGLFALTKNEDQLATIIAHELMHVRFAEKFESDEGRIATTKVEEYVADVVACATWVIKAGYAPRESVAVFDGLKEHVGEKEVRVMRPWIAYSDVHGLMENRSQALSGLIAKELKEKGVVPTTITRLSAETRAAVKAARHVSHFERVKMDPSYADAPVEQRYQRLVSELRNITAHTSGRTKECLAEFKDVFQALPVTPEVLEEVYSALKDHKVAAKTAVLREAYRAAGAQGAAVVLPKEIREVVQEMRKFISSRSDQELLSSGKKIAAFAREWKNGDPAIRAALKSSFDLKRVKPDNTPWERHLSLARSTASQGDTSMIEAMWALGAYESRVLNFASDAVLQSFPDMPLLVPCRDAELYVLNASGEWQRQVVKNPWQDSLTTMRQSYGDLVEAERRARLHDRAVSAGDSSLKRGDFDTIGNVPAETFAIDVAGIIHLFSDELVHPEKVAFYDGVFLNGLSAPDQEKELAGYDLGADEGRLEDDRDESGSSEISEALAAHYAHAGLLAKRFEEMLSHPDPGVRREASAGIRAFYLNAEGPCFTTLVGKFPVDGISTEEVCKHPLVTYVVTCPALTARERVEFLRGLENALSPAMWEKAYFTGYDLPTEREKLRHLAVVAPYQESALRAGASLLAHHFERAPIDPTAVLSCVAEHRTFFPALRQLDDEARQPILDHIKSVRSWDAPLTDLIDVFWALEQGRLFPPAETGVREMLRTKIISGIESIVDPTERKELAERVLLSPVSETTRISELASDSSQGGKAHDGASKRQEMFNRSSGLLSLKDPVVRSAVTTVWAEAVREIMSGDLSADLEGRDDGTARYISHAKPYLDRIVTAIRPRLPVQERRELLGALADELELQETLAFHLRDSITEHSRATVADAHEYFRSAEAGFEFINQDPWRRDAVVRFLSAPFTSENLHQFAIRVDISRNRECDALTKTVGNILERHEKELAGIRTRLKQIERYVDERAWLGDLFSKAHEEFLLFSDRVGTYEYHTEDLEEMLEKVTPEAIPESGRLAIIESLRGMQDYVSPTRARELVASCAEKVKPAFRAAMDSEREQFDAALQAGLTDLERLQSPVSQVEIDSIRRALFKRLADLPEYEFVGGIEDRLQAARGEVGLRTVITRAIEGLSKSFDRECAREESTFDKALVATLREIEKRQAQRETLERNRPTLVHDFHSQLRSFLTSFGDVISQEKFPELYWFNDRTPEELSSIFDESDHVEIPHELDTALGCLLTEQERLQDRERMFKARVERLSEMEGQVQRDINAIRRTAVPVSSVIEEAAKWLTDGMVEEDGVWTGSFNEEIVAEFNREYPLMRQDSKLPVTALEEQHARQFYELFWSQSAEVRSVALKLLLIPPEAEYQDRRSGTTDHFDKAFGFVADQIFPEGMRYGVESRKILRIFLAETDPSLRGFMLAALMAASEKVAGAPEEYSAGKRLAMILSMLGPAEKKLGQAINSHPLTPEDLRSDTKNIKSMSDPLPRWDLLERVAEAVPEAYRDAALPRVGRTLGAASYYIAVDCGDSVLSMLRPHARDLARTGLDRMEAVALRLSNDPELKRVAGPFVESIQQAREMIALETDHEKGVVQQVNAWRRYEGLSIAVDDDTFNFHTAAWKGCGPDFRHQERVEGEHFLDLFERDGAADPFTRKAALAHVTAELMNILSGQPFDHDRHGSQSKIKKGEDTHSIGLFDHGCMALTPPSAQEKEQLATVLCDLVQGSLEGKTGLLERAHAIIREQRERDGVAPSYLVSVERALLALNDFMRFDSSGESALLKRSDLGGVLAAVFRSGGVDPVFSSMIAQRFAGPGASMVLRFLSADQLCAKIAEKLEEQSKGAPIISIRRSKAPAMPDPIVFGGGALAA